MIMFGILVAYFQKGGAVLTGEEISILRNSVIPKTLRKETYPSIVQRVPQHMLASFLGITPETRSRIRKLQSKRK